MATDIKILGIVSKTRLGIVVVGICNSAIVPGHFVAAVAGIVDVVAVVGVYDARF